MAGWASDHGFEALEIACWPAAGAERRRYAGVCHVDVDALDASAIRGVRELLDSRRLTISSLAYYPNPLDPDPAQRTQAQAHLRKVIDAAARLGVNLVGTFIGRDQNRPPEPAFADVLEQWPPLVKFAAERGVRIAIENCPMIFSADEWPGGRNLAYSPALWRRLFEAMPGDTLGLNLDPSHLVWQFIDIPRVVREFGSKIYHVHAKDLEIDRACHRLRQRSIQLVEQRLVEPDRLRRCLRHQRPAFLQLRVLKQRVSPFRSGNRRCTADRGLARWPVTR